jgi:hypothetical protein
MSPDPANRAAKYVEKSQILYCAPRKGGTPIIIFSFGAQQCSALSYQRAVALPAVWLAGIIEVGNFPEIHADIQLLTVSGLAPGWNTALMGTTVSSNSLRFGIDLYTSASLVARNGYKVPAR